MQFHVAALLAMCIVVGACSNPTPNPAPAIRQRSAADPLPSWNQGPAKNAIVDFVERTNRQGTPEFVPPAERIAVFDNDGTLWAEQPIYVQLAFALDRVKTLAPQHPEWPTTQPFKAVIEGDVDAVIAGRCSSTDADRGGDACRDYHGGIRADCARLDRLGGASSDQAPL